MTRDTIWQELYFNAELRKMSARLIKSQLSEDLLCESIIHVFNRKGVAWCVDKHKENKLIGYVYQVMFACAYNPRMFFNKKYNHLAYNIVDFDITEEPSESEPLPTDRNEINESVELFGRADDDSIRIMRKLHDADMNKSNTGEWENAQLFKIYIEAGSFRKAEKLTGINYKSIFSKVNRFKQTMEEKKYTISVVTRDQTATNGMELYRLFYPYRELSGNADFTINQIPLATAINPGDYSFVSDAYVFSRLPDERIAMRVKEAGKKLIIDIDDYWNLDATHPLRGTPNNTAYVEGIKKTLPLADLVTCTNDTLAKHVEALTGKKPVVIKNTIPEHSGQFTNVTYPHYKVRFGWVGGVHHYGDVEPMYNSFERLHKEPSLKGKYQLCLGGFNTSHFGDGVPEYVKLERVFTSNYSCFNTTDDEYKKYLWQSTNAIEHISFDKQYRRLWAKDVNHYGEMYNQFDVALVPLKDTPFNNCKSELKMIEAGATGKALICQDVYPYSPHLQHEYNCLKVSPTRNDWYTQIRRFILDTDLRRECAENLTAYCRENFDSKKELIKLADALKQLFK